MIDDTNDRWDNEVSLPIHIIPDLPTPQQATGPTAIPPTPSSRREWIVRALIFALAFWLFIVALTVMKDGAKELAPALDGSTLTSSSTSALGFGWLAAMMVLSGSPVAASAMVFLGAHAVSLVGGLMMLTGSRLGASTVVLGVAIAYSLRGRGGHADRIASLSIGVFAIALTAIVYLPALLISIPMLNSHQLAGLDMTPPHALGDLIDTIAGPLVTVIESVVHGGWRFLAGLILLLICLRIIDHALPAAASAEKTREHTDWRNNRWLMFGLGSLVALVTMSVSVALTVLVPLVAKGHLKRVHAIPYILGANITTLGDTLLVAMVVGEPEGIEVILSELVGITAITAVLLLPGVYGALSKLLVAATDWLLARRRRAVCALIIFVGSPIVLVLAT